MKVVFPCKGALILLKKDVETLQAFYNTKIMQSPLYESYKNSDNLIHLGNFAYVPPKNTIVLHDPHLLTIDKMRDILGIYTPSAPTPTQTPVQQAPVSQERPSSDTKINDKELLSNPFFSTLTKLN